MKNFYLILIIILVYSCSSKNVSSDEYEIINEAIAEIVQPYGMTSMSQEELTEIASANGISLSGSMSQKNVKIIQDAVAERRKFEFAVDDSIRQSYAEKVQSVLDLDSIKPKNNELPSALLDLSKIKSPEHYQRVDKPSGNGEYIGKIILNRPLIDKSGEKAFIMYCKSKSGKEQECYPRILTFKKRHNEWIRQD
ncbi:hypothetical protein ASG01_06175 [Chryseobacterium sp. Leaf180]|uniref:hypothetical protein n=1 Tax=Chryseobacterium sp. Leaf180 TaxID=1736289 RepID=UPI0006F898C6|nr:hypothetical protein [Chryseobacterium sp. Leaf180]KQR95428.1 hypothetical protein ASG01_06175 [Chryseobacterium sp. Leaf180]